MFFALAIAMHSSSRNYCWLITYKFSRLWRRMLRSKLAIQPNTNTVLCWVCLRLGRWIADNFVWDMKAYVQSLEPNAYILLQNTLYKSRELWNIKLKYSLVVSYTASLMEHDSSLLIFRAHIPLSCWKTVPPKIISHWSSGTFSN